MNQGSEPPATGAADLSALVREPQQERSRRTLARVVDAAHDLLAAEGPDALTVTRIARRARTSVGSFYARFDGKEELVRYLGETSLARALTEWQDALDQTVEQGQDEPDTDADGDADPAVLGALTAALLEAFAQGAAGRLRALDGVEDPAPRRLSRFEDRVRNDLEALLARLGASELQRAVGAGMTLASIEAMSRSAPAGGLPAREVARAVALYLSLPAGETDEHAAPDQTPEQAPAAVASEPGVASEPAGAHEPAPPHEPEPAAAAPPAGDDHPTDDTGTAPGPDSADDHDDEPPTPPSEVDPFDVWN